MGCPGSGKSTVGAIVAEMLGMTLVDFDHDVLEKKWGMIVAEKVNDWKWGYCNTGNSTILGVFVVAAEITDFFPVVVFSLS